MVKKKRNLNKRDTADRDSDLELADSTSRSFIYDENDDFNELSDGDSVSDVAADPFTANDSESEKEEEVLGISYSSSEDSEEDIGPMDIDDIHSDEADSEEHDERSLGKLKKDFYGTDLTDQRIHKASKLKHKAKEEDALLLEEESVRRLQERMAKQSIGLAQSDLIPNIVEDKTHQVNLVEHSKKKKSDGKLAKISASEIGSIADHVKDVSVELKDTLSPLIEARRSGFNLSPSADEYLLTRYFLSLNYLSVVSAYMMILSSNSFTEDHPCVMRYEQFRHLFRELEPCKQKFDPELSEALLNVRSSKTALPRRKLLKLTMGNSGWTVMKTTKDSVSSKGEQQKIEEKRNFANPISSSDEDKEEKESDEEVDDVSATTEDERRLITYEIKKNKGLLPYRKKDQRNPRVKYKHKYQNKLKRRKGQVRQVRKEVSKYMGEVSGINRNVVKSIKLK